MKVILSHKGCIACLHERNSIAALIRTGNDKDSESMGDEVPVLKYVFMGHDKQNKFKIMIIYLLIIINICFVSSKEPPHRDVSFEYPKHVSVKIYEK